VLDMLVIMGARALDMMGMLWLLGHWVPLMMVFKPLVALLLRQCNARLLAPLFRKEPLLDLPVEVRKIHSMTLGISPIHGVAARNASLVSLRTTPSARLVVLTLVLTHRGQQVCRARRTDPRNPLPIAMLRLCPLRVNSVTPAVPASISWTTVCFAGQAPINPRNTHP